MLKLVYPACFYPCEDMDGFTVVVPDLPGCVTQGNDLANAIEMAVDAASGWVWIHLRMVRCRLSLRSNRKKIVLEYPDGFVSLIVLDMDEYAEKYGNKAVRKNLTIPAWLNTAAEKNGINFSSVLQNALMEQLSISR